VVLGLFGAGKVAGIEVVPDRPVYLPGDTVTARVRLTPAAGADRAECSVALVHRDRYGGGGNSSGGGDEWAVAGEYLLDEEPVRAGEAREWTVRLPVPRRTTPPVDVADCADERYPPSGEEADGDSYDLLIEPDERWGPPTSEGPGASSTWAVVCRFSGGRGRRAAGEAPVVVLAPPTAAPPPSPQRCGDGAPRCTVAFSGLPTRSVAAGSAIAGWLRLTAHEELEARAVRVELVRHAGPADGDAVLAWTVVAGAAASGALTLRPRQPRDLPFTVAVPADAGPSIESGTVRVRWLLQVVVDRPRRGDEVWHQTIAVHTAPG
jgi:hypothetical protein